MVTTAFRGAREIARHGEDAWCVPCDDAPALADGVQRVLGDQVLRASMVEQGARRVVAEFAPDRIMDRYSALYRAWTGA